MRFSVPYLFSIPLLFLTLLINATCRIALAEETHSGDLSSQYHIGWVWPDSLPKLGLGMGVDPQGNIYVSSEEGILYCLDNNGDIIWSYKPDCEYLSNPIVSDSTVYVAGTDGDFIEQYRYLYALDLNGRLKRKFSPTYRIGGNYIIDKDGNVHIESYSSGILAGVLNIDPDDREEFTYFAGKISPSQLIGIDSNSNYVLWQGNYESKISVFKNEGEVISSYPLGKGRQRLYPPIMSNNQIFVTTKDELFLALDENFDTLWTFTEQDAGENYLCSVENSDKDVVLLGTTAGEIYKFGKLNGSLIWQINLGDDFGKIISIKTDDLGSFLISGSKNVIAKIDGHGNILWRYKTPDYGRMGKPLVTLDNNLLVIQEGLLFKFTTDQTEIVERKEFFPKPPSKAVAEGELIDIILQYISNDIEKTRESYVEYRKKRDSTNNGFAKSTLVLQAQVLEKGVISFVGLRDQPLSVWVYENGQMNEKSDMEESINQHMEVIKKNPFGSYFRGYYAFGIDFIEEDTRNAIVYMGNFCGALCGSGYQLHFRKNSTGDWQLLAKTDEWIS